MWILVTCTYFCYIVHKKRPMSLIWQLVTPTTWLYEHCTLYTLGTATQPAALYQQLHQPSVRSSQVPFVYYAAWGMSLLETSIGVSQVHMCLMLDTCTFILFCFLSSHCIAIHHTHSNLSRLPPHKDPRLGQNLTHQSCWKKASYMH